jgi:hypothetical protein
LFVVEYVIPIEFGQTLLLPIMDGAGNELTVIAIDLGPLVPQEFVAVTFNVPLVAELLKSIVTELPVPFIVWPEPV